MTKSPNTHGGNLGLFMLFFKRDTRLLWASLQALFMPIFVFALALFLYSFLNHQDATEQPSTAEFSLFIVFLFMSICGGSKHLIADDDRCGFLETVSSKTQPYMISKLISYALPWIFSALCLWGFFDTINIANTVIFISLLMPLTALLLWVEALTLRGTQTAGIGLVIIAPAILPLFILSAWCYETVEKNQGLLALGLCGFILTTLSLWMTQKLIRSP